MKNIKSKMDFPNPIEHIEIGDKPLKLEELCRHIENGEITVILSENISDFKTFSAKITADKDCLILEKWIWGYGFLKRYANKIKKPVILRVDSKRQSKLMKNKSFAKHIKSAIRLNHKPYYYVVGCKCKSKEFDIGWTVIGVSVIKYPC